MTIDKVIKFTRSISIERAAINDVKKLGILFMSNETFVLLTFISNFFLNKMKKPQIFTWPVL